MVDCNVFFKPRDYTRCLKTETSVELLYDCRFECGRVLAMPDVWFFLNEQLHLPLFGKSFFFSWESASPP